jgi:hypothetical protein
MTILFKEIGKKLKIPLRSAYAVVKIHLNYTKIFSSLERFSL